MDIPDQILPFLSRQFHRGVFAIRFPSAPRAAIDEGARIARIVQDLQNPRVNHLPPEQIPFVDSATNATGKAKSLLAEITHRLRSQNRCG